MRWRAKMALQWPLIPLLLACGEYGTTGISKETAAPYIVNGSVTERFPEVGAMVIRPTSNEPWKTGCSGTLVSPTVFLTAGHCTVIWPGTEWGVSFDPVIGEHPHVITEGTWYRHPDFIFPDDAVAMVPPADSADLAVFVMSRPVSGIVPAKLPKLGFAARYASGEEGEENDLPSVTTVGYGVTFCEDFFNGAATAGTRRRATGGALGVEVIAGPGGGGGPLIPAPGWLTVQGDPGTAAILDSGGPTFVGDGRGNGRHIVLATTSLGDCQNVLSGYRVDTPHARAFLGKYVALP